VPRKRHSPEDILAMLRQVDALTSQGLTVADALRSIGLTEVTYRKWRPEYGGLIRILGPTPEKFSTEPTPQTQFRLRLP
jgi:transposase-like protein